MKHRIALYVTSVGVVCLAVGFFIGLSVGRTNLSRDLSSAEKSNSDSSRGNPRGQIGTGDEINQESPYSQGLADAQRSKVADAINQALQQPRPYDEVQLLAILRGLSKEEFPLFLQILRKTHQGANLTWSRYGGPVLWTMFWQKFGEVDPATALSNALTCGDLNYPFRETLEKHLFTGMARKDPKLAAELFLAHPELQNRIRAGEGLMLSWAGQDVEAAMKWAEQNLESDELALGTFAATWGVSNGLSERPDISRGLSFAESLDAGARANAFNALRMMILDRTQVSVPEMLQFVAATRSSSARDPEFEKQIAARSATLDPYRAAAFFAQPLANGETNDYAQLRSLTASWLQVDRNSAESWCKSQEGTEHFAILADEIAKEATSRGDAATAKQWTEIVTGLKSK